MITVVVPLHAVLPRKTKEDRKITLSMNIYRNLNHFSLNAIKKIIGDSIKSQVFAHGKVVEIPAPISVTVEAWFPDRTGKDLANFAPVAQKFSDDALVEQGYFKDDNIKFITECHYYFRGIDKINPRFEITYNTVPRVLKDSKQ